MSSNPQGNSSTTQENEHLFTDDGLTRKLGLSTAIAICIGCLLYTSDAADD